MNRRPRTRREADAATPADAAPEGRAPLGRRRFLRIAAATTAAAFALPAADVARAATRRARSPARPAPAPQPATPASGSGRVADPREVAKLKGYLADSLKAVRGFPLATGSDMAFTFRPLRPVRARKGR